jgi:hypothetical protein
VARPTRPLRLLRRWCAIQWHRRYRGAVPGGDP